MEWDWRASAHLFHTRSSRQIAKVRRSSSSRKPSSSNAITEFNPDTGQTQTIKVGINPNAIAYNFQTGTILTVNSLSNTISVVDSQTFATKATLGIGATSKFAAAIQTFTNLAVIADQANNRVILLPLPK